MPIDTELNEDLFIMLLLLGTGSLSGDFYQICSCFISQVYHCFHNDCLRIQLLSLRTENGEGFEQ